MFLKKKFFTLCGPVLIQHWTQHLIWAHDITNWTLDDWQHTVRFSELWYQLFQIDGNVWVWHKPSDQQGAMQANLSSIIVCSVFMWHGWGLPMWLVTATLNCFMICLNGFHVDPTTLFQQDNALGNQAQVARELVWRAFWRFVMDEPNYAFISCGVRGYLFDAVHKY